jgi:hypothetical protein
MRHDQRLVNPLRSREEDVSTAECYNKPGMKAWVTAAATLLAVTMISGCYVFENPVDPAADNYQGYPSGTPVPHAP